MGRKKAKRTKIRKRAPLKLETKFDCVKCHHEKSVECKIHKASKIGNAYCRICEAQYSCNINSLDNPIDIYYRWIDDLNE